LQTRSGCSDDIVYWSHLCRTRPCSEIQNETSSIPLWCGHSYQPRRSRIGQIITIEKSLLTGFAWCVLTCVYLLGLGDSRAAAHGETATQIGNRGAAHGETTARQLGETPRRDIRAAKRPRGVAARLPRVETSARRDSRVATARRDSIETHAETLQRQHPRGEIAETAARWLRGETVTWCDCIQGIEMSVRFKWAGEVISIVSRLPPSPAQGFDSCSACVFSACSTNSAVTAAAAAAFGGRSLQGGRSQNSTIVGTAVAAALTLSYTCASALLKSIVSLSTVPGSFQNPQMPNVFFHHSFMQFVNLAIFWRDSNLEFLHCMYVDRNSGVSVCVLANFLPDNQA
jgi:hypothetical protein